MYFVVYFNQVAHALHLTCRLIWAFFTHFYSVLLHFEGKNKVKKMISHKKQKTHWLVKIYNSTHCFYYCLWILGQDYWDCGNLQKCAGFTLRGSLDNLDLPTWVYFVHHFPKELLEEPKGYSANWISYRTKRPVVVLIGILHFF